MIRMTRMIQLVIGLMVLQGASLVAARAGFDGDAEHLKVTRPPIPFLTGLGTVNFPITCQDAKTQKYFNQGIALLHGLDSGAADRSFYECTQIEPSNAMAWCGLAMANVENRPLAAFYVDRALQRMGGASDREIQWIRAFRSYLDPGPEVDRRTFLITSFDRVIQRYPDDVEAHAFMVRQILDNRDAGIPIPLTSTADLLIDHVLRQVPTHPAHHYKLLLWEADQPRRALASAAKVSQVLPSAALIQTAAARVYARLNRPSEALACLESFNEITADRMRRDHMCPAEIPGFVESIGLQIDLLAIVGRVHESIALAVQLIEMPFPEVAVAVNTEPIAASHMSRAINLRRASPPLPPSTLAQQKLLDILVDYRRWNQLLSLSNGNYFESPDQVVRSRWMHAVGLAHFHQGDTEALAAQIAALQALLEDWDRTEGVTGRSVRKIDVAHAIQDLEACAGALKSGTTTPLPVAPSSRLADLFPESFQHTADESSGPVSNRQPGVAQGLILAARLKRRDQQPAATELLDKLKQQFPDMDADLVGGPPAALPSTRWQPPALPPFQLPDRFGNVLSMERFRGRQVVLVFYLGAGCPHCIEQLKTFAPLREKYEQAGLTVIAVSTDSVDGLQKTFQVAGAGDAIPFQLVSDEKQSTFAEFGAMDSRNNEPLHGTYLISPQGRILWHNIRREPFMATRSLLDEARRVFSVGNQFSGLVTSGDSAK